MSSLRYMTQDTHKILGLFHRTKSVKFRRINKMSIDFASLSDLSVFYSKGHQHYSCMTSTCTFTHISRWIAWWHLLYSAHVNLLHHSTAVAPHPCDRDGTPKKGLCLRSMTQDTCKLHGNRTTSVLIRRINEMGINCSPFFERFQKNKWCQHFNLESLDDIWRRRY